MRKKLPFSSVRIFLITAFLFSQTNWAEKNQLVLMVSNYFIPALADFPERAGQPMHIGEIPLEDLSDKIIFKLAIGSARAHQGLGGIFTSIIQMVLVSMAGNLRSCIFSLITKQPILKAFGSMRTFAKKDLAKFYSNFTHFLHAITN